MDRQLPRWDDIRPLLQMKRPGLGPASRVALAGSIWDLRRIAKRRTPRAPFDYVDGAAESEISLNRSRALYERVEFVPSVLHDVSSIDTTTTLLGRPSTLPLAFAPTGFTRMMHHEGERAVARAAQRAGIIFSLSTMGTTSPEDVAAAAPGVERWFQLYLMKNRQASAELLQRAEAAGYTAAMLTVDTPVGGRRLRDVRNGFTIPPALSIRTLADMAIHPAWWFNLLTTEPLSFASLKSYEGTVSSLVTDMFDPTLNLADIDWMREHWKGPVVIKGIQTPEDARRVVDHGADAIIVSNHGGRQLDRAPTPFQQLPSIAEAVGDECEVYIDGGIMSGGDVVAAVARGAKAAFVGRAYLYGLMAGGEQGVDRAIDIFHEGIVKTMQLLGVSSLQQLTPGHVRLRPA